MADLTHELVAVECPSQTCGRSFPVEPARIGRNLYCLYCGSRMTARPAGLANALRDRERAIGKAAVEIDEIPRLPLRVLVDNVRSLWNVGAIFRTADACGVERLDLCGITGTPPRAEIAKTALGAESHVRWKYWAEPQEALERARADGYSPVALETGGRSIPVHSFRWPSPCCLVLGNEVAGVAESLLAASDLRVHIPMRGVKDSLNVAVAFGIAAHLAALSLVQFAESSQQDQETE